MSASGVRDRGSRGRDGPRSNGTGGWIHASVARYLAQEAAVAAIGAALLLAARLLPQIISPLAFWLLLAAWLAACGADYLRWHLRGVRSAHLDGAGLTLVRGHRRDRLRLERTAVASLRPRAAWGGLRVDIRRRGRPCRLVLQDDAFDRNDFARLSQALAAWVSAAPRGR